MRAEIGKPKTTVPLFVVSDEVKHFVHEKIAPQINNILDSGYGKSERGGALDAVTQRFKSKRATAIHAAEVASRSGFRSQKSSARDDSEREQARGRTRYQNGSSAFGTKSVSCPRAHGSGLFQRGETQVLDHCDAGHAERRAKD